MGKARQVREEEEDAAGGQEGAVLSVAELAASAWGNERPRKPSDEMTSYLKQVGGSLASALGTRERSALVANVFEEVAGHEASLACSRRTAFVFEALLKHASAPQLTSSLANSKRYFGFLCTNRQASHVLQTLLTRAFAVLFPRAVATPPSEATAGEEEEEEEEEKEEVEGHGPSEGKDEALGASDLKALVGDLCLTLVTKELWWDMMFDPCATHVLRSLVSLLACKDPALAKAKRHSDAQVVGAHSRGGKHGKLAQDASFNASLHAFLVGMSKWEASELKQACADAQASPLVQLLLSHSSSRHKGWGACLGKILCAPQAQAHEHAHAHAGEAQSKAAAAPSADPAVFASLSKDRVASHVMQILLSSCDDQTFAELFFARCLQGRMAALVQDNVANFVLQNALAALRTPEQVALALDELEPELAASLLSGRLGAVWRLCQAALRCDKALQGRLCRAVIKGVRARDEAKVAAGTAKGAVEMLLELRVGAAEAPAPGSTAGARTSASASADADADAHAPPSSPPAFEKVSVNILGANIAGALLALAPEAVRVLLESLASMGAPALRTCCNDPVAGRVVMEALMDAAPAAAWAKQRVLDKLRDELPAIASNKFGWHVLRKAFDGGLIKEKTIIARALAKSERRVAGSVGGAKLIKHCKVALFAKHPDQWEAAVKHSGQKKRKAAAESILVEMDQAVAKAKQAKKQRA